MIIPALLEHRGLRDFAELASAHEQCFDDGWSGDAFAALLATQGCFTLTLGSELQGFIVGRMAADEVEVLTLAVRPSWRRRGVGTRLVTSASQHAARHGCRLMFLEVNAGNAPARRLYAGLGFSEAGMRRGYYLRRTGPNEDGIVLRSSIPLSPVGNGTALR